jgi:hypothetical protein
MAPRDFVMKVENPRKAMDQSIIYVLISPSLTWLYLDWLEAQRLKQGCK